MLNEVKHLVFRLGSRLKARSFSEERFKMTLWVRASDDKVGLSSEHPPPERPPYVILNEVKDLLPGIPVG